MASVGAKQRTRRSGSQGWGGDMKVREGAGVGGGEEVESKFCLVVEVFQQFCDEQ